MDPRKYLKAIAGGILAGLGVVVFALNDDIITAQEWAQAAQASLAAALGVYGIPNKEGGKHAATD